MRMKALIKNHLITGRYAILIFFTFFMAGTLLGSVISSIAQGNFGVSDTSVDGVTNTWSTSIISFVIFMSIFSLISSQQSTRFLITRSVSRKEIFFSYALFFIPLTAFMTILQMISICIDAAVRSYLGGEKFKGLRLDIQHTQAPDMDNIFIFFIVSFSILISFGAATYLLGSCIARWKVQTFCAITLIGIVFMTCLFLPEFQRSLFDVMTFMFTDEESGLIIAAKQLPLAGILMLIAFPVMRGITAAKQSK